MFQGGSSSLLATAGHSQDGRNVALWDTLLPARKACVQSYRSATTIKVLFFSTNNKYLSLYFSSHDAGASALVHANQHHLLISAGKKGQICIWDVRQAKLLHTFKVKMLRGRNLFNCADYDCLL